VLLLLLVCRAAAAGERREYQGPYLENDDLLVVVIPRTPAQMAAFYEARGFPPEAIALIRGTCFMTVHIENKRDGILWLDLDQWQFTADGRPLARIGVPDWAARWDAIELRQASRSTFGWTLLPALRDLHPDESVGGNLVFPGDTATLTIEAHFPAGPDRQGAPVSAAFGRLHCARDAAP
jgi:hypothetical protein